jgi:hypothetical protein
MVRRYAVSREFFTKRFVFVLSPRDHQLLTRLARREGEPVAVVLRRLVRQAARDAGIEAYEEQPGRTQVQFVDGYHLGELEETLVAVQHTLSEIQQQGIALPDSTLTSEEVEHLSEVADAPKLDAKHKLKITVPIIPYLLSYEGEVELKSGLNLEAVWKRLVAKVRGT